MEMLLRVMWMQPQILSPYTMGPINSTRPKYGQLWYLKLDREMSNCEIQVTAVVTQPGRPKGRGKVPQPSPVQLLAHERGLSEDQVLSPIKAREVRGIPFE